MSHTASPPLAEYALLAALNIRQWTARKYDRKVSSEVDRNHGAKDAGRFNKLLIDKAALDPIEKVVNGARQTHYKYTLPWGDNGERLLVGRLFNEFSQTMRQFHQEFDNRVRVFLESYPQLRDNARQRLGTLYQPDDYPPDIADRFAFSVNFAPVPTAGDFRVSLSQEHIEYIKSDLEQRLTERQNQAVRDVWTRVRTIVGKIHEQTADEDRKIYDSAMDNAREFVDLLPALNLTNDPALVEIERDIRALLVHPDRLRQDKGLRAQTADAAEAILARLPWA